jgi:hypothetical protein
MEVSIELHRILSPSQCEQRYIELLEAAREFLKGTVVYLKHEPDQSVTLPSQCTESASTAPGPESMDCSEIDASALAVSDVKARKDRRRLPS